MKKINLITPIIFCFIFGINPLSAKNAAKPDSLKNQTTNSARLQLPDEIIYGQNKSRRTSVGSKKSFNSKFLLLQPELKLNFQKNEIAETKFYFPQQRDGRNERQAFAAHWGRFQVINFQGNWFQQADKFNFQLGGQFQNIAGQYENSQFQNISFHSGVSSHFSDNLSALLNFNGKLQKFGLFQALQSNEATRDVRQIQTNLFFNYSGNSGHSLEGKVFFDANRFQNSDTTNVQLDDNLFGFSASYTKKFQSLFLSIQSDYRRNSFGENQTQNIFAAKSGLGFAPLKFLRLNVNVLYQDIEVNPGKSQTLFSPDLQLIFTPQWNFGGKISISRGLSPVIFNDWFDKNQYIDFEQNLLPIEQNFQLKSSIEWVRTENLNLKAEFEFEKRKNDVYWVKNSRTSLFALNRLESTKRTQLSLGARIDLSPNMHIDGKINATFYSIGDDSLKDASAHMPYTEKLNLPISVTWGIGKNWLLNMGMNYVGSRYMKISGDEKLPSFLWISAKAERKLLNNFSLFLQTTNLLDQSIEIWESFPERGISVLVGIRGKW